MYLLDNFQGQVHQKIIYSALDDWKRSGLFCLPNQNEFMHETYKGASMPFSEFWVLLQFYHTELSLSTQKFSKWSTANLVSAWPISDQSPCSRHDKIKNSASKLNNQLLQFTNKNLKPIPCILVGGNYLQVAPLPPTEQILIRFELSQMLHPLYYLLSCLQY